MLNDTPHYHCDIFDNPDFENYRASNLFQPMTLQYFGHVVAHFQMKVRQ